MNNPGEFLNHLFNNTAGYFELTFIAPKGVAPLDGGKRVFSHSYRIGYEVPDWQQVEMLNFAGYGVYYGLTTKRQHVKPGRRSREQDTLWCPVLWCEVDLQDGYYSSFDDIHAAMLDFAQPPTVIIHSGGGLHALWRIKPIQVTRDTLPAIKQTLRGLALFIHGDTSVAETARVFRLPGTINTKPERHGARCEVIDLLPGELTFDQFADYRALAEPAARPIERDLQPIRPDDVPGYVSWYTDQPHPQGQRNSALNWAAHKMYTDGFSEDDATGWLLPRALNDGLSENEARRTIRSAFTGKRGVPSYLTRRGASRMRAGDSVERGEE